MIGRLLRRLRPAGRETRRTEAEAARERKWNARADLVDGKGITPDGKLMDFDSDLEPPRR